MIITLVRHSEVIKEYQGKYNGHIDIALSDKGKKDAKELAEKLKHINFDKVYCSDLLRAKETLNEFDLDVTPIYTPKLREKSWGKHEGKSFDEIQKSGLKYENFEQWIEDLGGESIDVFISRIKEYFYKEVFTQKSKNILIVTHSGVIKSLLSLIKKMALQEAFSMNLDYSSYIRVALDNGKIRLLNS